MQQVVDALKQQNAARDGLLAAACGENVADANLSENILSAQPGAKTKAASSTGGPKAQPTPKQLNRARRGSAKASSVPAKGSEGLGLLGLF